MNTVVKVTNLLPVRQNERPILDERTPLRSSMLRCYALLSTSFTRLKQLMIRDPRQRGRGFAVLYQLQQVFMSFEENRSNSSNYSLLHQMMASKSNMEEVAQVQVSSSFEIDGTDVLVERLNQDPELQPEAEMPTNDERGDAPMYEGDIPAAHEQTSPESIAGWMVKRLTRRIYSACVSGSSSLKRYCAMKELMRRTALICQRSEQDRRRAMFIFHDIRDLSDQSSSDASDRDPIEDFIDEFTGDDGMDLSESYQGDFYDFQERVHGPLDAVRGTRQRAATIPAYVVMNGQVVYTIDVDELRGEAIRYESDGDWAYYTFLGHWYRVRNFLTDEETRGNTSSSNA